jgi:hypothetical protein
VATILYQADRETLFLAMRDILTVVASAGGSANVTRLGDKAGEPAQAVVAVGDAGKSEDEQR